MRYNTRMNSKAHPLVERLAYLNKMLNKYSHRWCANGSDSSQRMYNWVDEYNTIKESNRPVWEAYCNQFGRSLGHDAYDCMA